MNNSAPVVRVKVPASTANLGAGFDTLGLALSIYDELEFELTSHGLSVDITGQNEGLATDESNLVVRAFLAGCEYVRFSVPGLNVWCRNSIPQSRGLGSSASAAVAGVAAAFALAGRSLDHNALRIAAEFDGHADNVAASMLGGLTIAWSENSEFHATKLSVHVDVKPIVLISSQRSMTYVTRGLLPLVVPHEVAAFTGSRAALAVHALTHNPLLLRAALVDRLHEPYRESAWPNTMRLVIALREVGVPAAVSGSGPSVIAFPSESSLPAEIDVSGFDVHPVEVDNQGVVATLID